MQKWLIVAGSVLLLFFSSCRKQKDLTTAPFNEQDFYPLAEGSYKIYAVKKDIYTLQADTFKTYQIKEVMTEPWVDLEGKTSYKLYRYKRNDENASFVLDSIWNVKKLEKNSVVRTENNVPFLVIDSPFLEGKTWNGNRYNIYAEEFYKIRGLGAAWGNYSNTITIVQKEERKN